MKRNLIYGLIAILAIGLAVVGCSNGSTNSPPPGGTVGFDALTPWAPSPIVEPAEYKAFPKGDDDTGLLGNTAFYVSTGGEGVIEEGDDDGTYKVTVQTNPGGVSLISFQDADYVYKTGYYLSLQLPTASADNPHKPIMAVTYVAVGPQETGNNWNTASRVNMTNNNTLDKDNVYLAGQIDFAWENENNIIPYRTLCLRLYWHEDEEVGNYEFTVRKILVTDDDDLTPPAYPYISWAPPAIPAPTGWIDFPAASITGATVETGAGAVTITVDNVADGYSITIPTFAGGLTEIHFPAATGSDFTNGYYLSLNLPSNNDEESLRPYRVYSYPNAYWDGAVDLNPNEDASVSGTGYYVAGNVDMQWTNIGDPPNTSTLNTINLQFYWHEDEPADGTYTFILKKLKITSDEIVIVDPDELEPWTPDPVAEPDGWVTFPGSETLMATYYPWATTTTGNSITAAYSPTDSSRTLVRLSGDAFKYKKGIYVSVTLPNNSLKPSRIIAYPSTTKLEGGITPGNDWSICDDIQAPAGKFIAGKVDFKWDKSDSAHVFQGIILDIYWHAEQEAGAYAFTINSIKVAEETTERPPDPDELEPWTPDPVAEPDGWVTFPGSETLRSTFYPWNAGNKIEGNTVTVVAPASGRTLVRFFGTDFQWEKGYYLSVTLPNNANKPSKIYSLGANTDGDDGIWAVSDTVDAGAGKFVAGRVDFTWANNESTAAYKGVMLDIYWHEEQTEAMYSFTINKILVAGESTGGPPPAEKPVIHDTSQLDGATYTVGATAAPLVVVPALDTHSGEYIYSWFKTPTGALHDSSWISDGTPNTDSQGVYFVPPTDTAGIVYYFVKIEFGSEITYSDFVKITVND
ncbi:MAG: hypothetical protein LBB72_06360 [Spirochaetaceae bacterium]|nr:hypothetical protein [Spirochaetaceae bacterium]